MYQAKAAVTVPAEIGEVWTYISDYQNFDRFMSHIQRVEMIGDRTSQWQLGGPLGIPVTWKAVTTVMDPARELAWQSIEGDIKTHGSILLEPDGGGTRVSVDLEYAPPGGVVGEAFAKIFANPQKMLEDDLNNLAHIVAGWPHEPAQPEGEASQKSSTPNPLESELVEKSNEP